MHRFFGDFVLQWFSFGENKLRPLTTLQKGSKLLISTFVLYTSIVVKKLKRRICFFYFL